MSDPVAGTLAEHVARLFPAVRADLESLGTLTVTAPSLARDINDLDSLLELGTHLVAGP